MFECKHTIAMIKESIMILSSCNKTFDKKKREKSVCIYVNNMCCMY